MASEPVSRPQRKPRYDGEDTNPTTQRELLGWYSYGVAAEVFAVCGVGKHFLAYSWSEQVKSEVDDHQVHSCQ
jgi:hypothetical protein